MRQNVINSAGTTESSTGYKQGVSDSEGWLSWISCCHLLACLTCGHYCRNWAFPWKIMILGKLHFFNVSLSWLTAFCYIYYQRLNSLIRYCTLCCHERIKIFRWFVPHEFPFFNLFGQVGSAIKYWGDVHTLLHRIMWSCWLHVTHPQVTFEFLVWPCLNFIGVKSKWYSISLTKQLCRRGGRGKAHRWFLHWS